MVCPKCLGIKNLSNVSGLNFSINNFYTHFKRTHETLAIETPENDQENASMDTDDGGHNARKDPLLGDGDDEMTGGKYFKFQSIT